MYPDPETPSPHQRGLPLQSEHDLGEPQVVAPEAERHDIPPTLPHGGSAERVGELSADVRSSVVENTSSLIAPVHAWNSKSTVRPGRSSARSSTPSRPRLGFELAVVVGQRPLTLLAPMGILRDERQPLTGRIRVTQRQPADRFRRLLSGRRRRDRLALGQQDGDDGDHGQPDHPPAHCATSHRRQPRIAIPGPRAPSAHRSEATLPSRSTQQHHHPPTHGDGLEVLRDDGRARWILHDQIPRAVQQNVEADVVPVAVP